MYIHPRVAITFEKIFSPEKNTVFSIGSVMQGLPEFNCKDFVARIGEFKPFRAARVKRTFEGRRDSIFFDKEEVEILAEIFACEKFTAIVNVAVDGELVEIKDMPPNLYKIVAPLLEFYGAIHPLPANEYRQYASAKRVTIKRRTKIMKNQKQSWSKLAFGAVLALVGMGAMAIGVDNFLDAYRAISRKTEDVILIDSED